MCFKSVNFSFLDCSIGKSYRGSAFPLTPATFAVCAVQIASNVYSPACGDCFNVFDLAEDLEFHHTLSLLRYPFDSGETANAPAHRSCPHAAFQRFHSRHRAAMRWRRQLKDSSPLVTISSILSSWSKLPARSAVCSSTLDCFCLSTASESHNNWPLALSSASAPTPDPD